MVKEINYDNILETVESGVPVVIDFWAEWCGPCRRMSQVVEELSNEMKGVEICKCDIDKYPEIGETFGVKGIPTFVFIYGGESTGSYIGTATKAQLRDMIERLKQISNGQETLKTV